MTTTSYPFNFTSLIEPTSSVSANPPGAPFDAGMAYFLGQCCELTYQQFATGSITASDIQSLTLAGSLAGYSISSVSSLTPFTVSEELGPASVPEEAGTYVTLPAGFGALLTFSGSNPFTIVVIALRGTQTWEEWIEDVDAFPTPFAGLTPTNGGLGSVHSGFYGYYTVGTAGATASPGNELSPTLSNRASGSIAQQICGFIAAFTNVNVYVTGHSLGAATAGLCALDIAYNFTDYASSVSVVTLASPRIAVGVAADGIDIPTLGNQQNLVANFQSLVQNSWAIVHSCDIVPILPPSSTALSALTVSCEQVTATVNARGSDATATASVSNGSVTSINVTSSGTGYSGSAVPVIVLSGGGGSGATAYASVDLLGYVSITVINGGSGYTSAPTVQILNTVPTTSSVINFCAQTGDIEGNHSCVSTYVPYLQQLANSFT